MSETVTAKRQIMKCWKEQT